MMAIRMQQHPVVAHDTDMARPEYKIAAPQRRACGQGDAERCLLLIAVAGRGKARGVQRDLHEPGTIKTEPGAPTPKIGHRQKGFGNRDEIRGAAIDRAGMGSDHEAAAIERQEPLVLRAGGEPRPKRQP
jgi:hypothetical protein